MATASDDQADKLGVDPNMVGAYEVLDLRAALSASESARREAEVACRGKIGFLVTVTEANTFIEMHLTGDVHGFSLAEVFENLLRERNEARSALASERAAREKAERLLAECDDELENASCPPMTNETIPERIARLAGLVSSTARDEQTALEGKVAAESRLAEAEAALREIRDELGVPQPGYPAPVANAARIADAFLAGGKS